MKRHLFIPILGLLLLTQACGGTDESGGDADFLCGPRNCSAGCCLDNVCYGGGSAATCGKEGTKCDACLGIKSCETQQGECTLDLLAIWKIQPTDASLVPEDPNDGLSWDADGSPPDVLIELTCPTSEAPVVSRTQEVESLTPTWTAGGCATVADALLKSPIGIKIIDVDVAIDDEIFAGSYMFTEADFEAGKIVLQGANTVTSLSFQLTREQ
ncbi:MAG: hypothetical protein JXB05_09655 [Myxococcaceae bacterium]|nr:hypothetical protein [Myxococcaceae bacterium]